MHTCSFTVQHCELSPVFKCWIRDSPLGLTYVNNSLESTAVYIPCLSIHVRSRSKHRKNQVYVHASSADYNIKSLDKDSRSFENVGKFKCLRLRVRNQYCIHEEIKSK
jgi:hypothetical protein